MRANELASAQLSGGTSFRFACWPSGRTNQLLPEELPIHPTISSLLFEPCVSRASFSIKFINTPQRSFAWTRSESLLIVTSLRPVASHFSASLVILQVRVFEFWVLTSGLLHELCTSLPARHPSKIATIFNRRFAIFTRDISLSNSLCVSC